MGEGRQCHCHDHPLGGERESKPHSHTAILSHRHTAILSYSHTVILSYCHTAIQPYCHTVIQLYCHTVILCKGIGSGSRSFEGGLPLEPT